MKHPITVYLIILILIYLGLYSCWGVFERWDDISPIDIVVASVSLTAAIGLYFLKNWAKYLIYIISISTLCISVVFMYGFIEMVLPHTTNTQEKTLPLIKLVLIILLCLCSSLFVRNYLDTKLK